MSDSLPLTAMGDSGDNSRNHRIRLYKLIVQRSVSTFMMGYFSRSVIKLTGPVSITDPDMSFYSVVLVK